MKEKLIAGDGISMVEIARSEGCTGSYATRMIRLSLLSPEITAAILNGRQSPNMTPDSLTRNNLFPLDWQDQLEMFKAP